MAITTVPASFRRGFAIIKKLSPADFDAIVATLEAAPVLGGLKELTSTVAQKVPRQSRQDIEALLRSVFSLSVFLADQETPLSENLANLSAAMQANSGPESLTETERATFEQRLDKLLHVRSIVMSAKVQSLRFEYPNTLHDAMILTDMRPIFDKPEDRPVGFALSHTLKITYHVAGEHKEFYVMLDASDLEMMKKQVERAEIKAASLKSVLKTASMPDLS
ncbi:MAG TPA: hypothetical protein VJN69_07785 [Candidatus Acidoferrales bacterium]|nr:hypothetical protein [Candidatus Acidoferrales bacterium]